jgi:hypothetical protein
MCLNFKSDDIVMILYLCQISYCADTVEGRINAAKNSRVFEIKKNLKIKDFSYTEDPRVVPARWALHGPSKKRHIHADGFDSLRCCGTGPAFGHPSQCLCIRWN